MQWKQLVNVLVIFFLSSMPSLFYAKKAWNERADVGYWFYHTKTQVKKKTRRMMAKEKTEEKVVKKQSCQRLKQWNVSCGFVKPATYAFEQKEYHALLENFSMHPKNINAVYQFQRFNYWAVSQAMTATYTWQYNQAQHPDVDGTVKNPLSQFGHLLVMHIKQTRQQDFFRWLAASSLLVYFSRSNCPVCAGEAPIVLAFAKKTKIPLWNASLDQTPLPGFTHVMVLPATIKPARLLKVTRVPALFIYLAPNASGAGAKWIRITNGLSSEATIRDRIINFVEAYRHAMLKGATATGGQA